MDPRAGAMFSGGLGESSGDIEAIQYLPIAVRGDIVKLFQWCVPQDRDWFFNAEPRCRECFVDAVDSKPVRTLRSNRRDRLQPMTVCVCFDYGHDRSTGTRCTAE